MCHSKYAPTEGFRYDGIYKLVRYWPMARKGQGRVCDVQVPVQEGRSGSSTMDRRRGSDGRG
ncbi:hypothetical protein BGX38DRAFT_1187918, partial [Terfezia claveryi]